MVEKAEIEFELVKSGVPSALMEVQAGEIFKFALVDVGLVVSANRVSVTPFVVRVTPLAMVCGAISDLAPQLALLGVAIPTIGTPIRAVCGAIFKIAPLIALVGVPFAPVVAPIAPVCGANSDLAPQTA